MSDAEFQHFKSHRLFIIALATMPSGKRVPELRIPCRATYGVDTRATDPLKTMLSKADWTIFRA